MAFLAAAAIASALKVRLPGVTGTVSVSFLFVLAAIVNLSLPEALAVGALSMLVQSFWHARKRPRPVQLCFNLCSAAAAISGSSLAYSYVLNRTSGLLALTTLSLAYYFTNTFAVAGIIAL